MEIVYEFVAFAAVTTVIHFRALRIGRKRGLEEAVRIGQAHMRSVGKISPSVSEVLHMIENGISK